MRNDGLKFSGLLLFISTADHLGIIFSSYRSTDFPLEMTEEYVLRCVLMLCCALLSANASNWL